MTRARDIADLVDANGDIVADALDNVPAGGGDVVDDITPELGGNLSSNGNDINFGDSDKAIFGAGSDLQIYHDGSDSYIAEGGSGTGSLKIKANNLLAYNNSDVPYFQGVTGGTFRIYHNGSTKLATTATGIDVTGSVTADGLTLGDNEKAFFGAGNDLQIWHNGSNSYIDENGTGNLRIRAVDLEIMKAGTAEYMIRGVADGAVTLYYDNAAKIATTATGVSVTGTVAATAVTGDGSGLTGVSGGLVQTVSTHHVTSTTISGTAFTQYSGLNTAITPTSSSNKVLVTVHISFSGVTDAFPAFKIYRGGTWIGQSATVSPGIETTFAHAIPTGGASPTTQMGVASFTFLDSPSTTSATTYSVYISPMRTTSRTLRINESYSRGDDNQYSAGSTMTLMEVV